MPTTNLRPLYANIPKDLKGSLESDASAHGRSQRDELVLVLRVGLAALRVAEGTET
jgi:plasmid stability protein